METLFMPDKNTLVINIALVGGGIYSKEFLEKSDINYRKGEVNARIIAVADSDPKTPGMMLAKKMGLITVNDYHELYSPEYNIHLITILTPEEIILEDILKTKPANIRALSYQSFEIFWKVIRLEEQKLRAHNVEMQTILNGIQDFILVVTPEREIVEVNESFLKHMNYSREDVLGRKCYEIFKEVTRKSSNCHRVCPLGETISNEKPSQRLLTRLGPDGKPRYTELTIFPIWGKSGYVSKFIEISRDITKRKTKEDEMTQRLEKMVEERTHQLRETHNKLLHQDKMASLGKLSASVVHEINNPIAGILNLTMLIKRIIAEGTVNEKELDQFGNYLNLMETESRRISRIVSNLLAFSRQSKMEFTGIKVNQLIENSLLLNSNLLKISGVRVEKALDPTLPDFTGSEDQLQQVFMNFISNAAESLTSKGGGLLSIETGHTPGDNNIVIQIKDSGGGISKDNLPRIFEPFFTTKKKGKGVGLGLSVVYGIIQDHDGSIHVNSKEGEGTTFEIKLPLKQLPNTPDRI
jgi:two-component system NtrC family sensor kinase